MGQADDNAASERAHYESRARYPTSWAISAAVVVMIGTVVSGGSWAFGIGAGILAGLVESTFSRSRFVQERIQHLGRYSRD